VYKIHGPYIVWGNGYMTILPKLRLDPPLWRLVSQLQTQFFVNTIGFLHVDQVVEKITTTLPKMTEQNPSGDVMEIDISSGVELDLLSLATIVHYLSQSTSVIRYGMDAINVIQKVQFEEVLIKNQVPNKFVESIIETIHAYKAVYN